MFLVLGKELTSEALLMMQFCPHKMMVLKLVSKISPAAWCEALERLQV